MNNQTGRQGAGNMGARTRQGRSLAVIAVAVIAVAVIAIIALSRTGTGVERGSQAPATARAMPGGTDAGRAGTVGTPSTAGSGPVQRNVEG